MPVMATLYAKSTKNKEKLVVDKMSLRKQAEKRLSEKPRTSVKKSMADTASLIHELQVHQIELEMQNDELRQAQATIENSNKRFSDLYDFAPVGYFTLEPDGKIKEANLTASILLGFDRSYLIGKPFTLFIHPQDKDVFYLYLKRMHKNLRDSCEIRLIKKNTASFYAQLIGTTLSAGQGASKEILVAVFDGNERKQWENSISELNERLLISNKELEGLGHMLSHDLRAPIVTIEGFVRILLEKHAGSLDAEAKKFLQIIDENVHRMAGMIAGLLNISQIVRAEIRLEKIDISALVRSIFKEYMMTQPDREVELSIQEGLFAEADAKLIQIALVNLIGNAWKFTGKLDKAHIEFGKTETAGTEEFFLRDNGAGFDMKNAPNVFTVFRRLHADSEFKGTGVGLATVRRIIKRHGGEIRAEAEVNKGATFYFTLS
jgi:PAS domain S-box-containing protein